MELYAGIDVMVKAVDLPLFIKGFLKEDRGFYYIYINQNISLEQQMKAIKHEYNHLIKADIFSSENTITIERRNEP